MSQNDDYTAKAIEALYLSGAISDEAKDALKALPSAGEQLALGLGDPASRAELLLAVILVDDSTSVGLNMPEIRAGHTVMLEALHAEPFDADVQVQTRALNRGVVSAYKSLATAVSLTEANYNGNRLVPQTPLYLQSLLTLGAVMVKAQREEANGVKVRTFTLIMTDGEDNSSGDVTAASVKALVTDMLDFASNHIVAGMGVGEKPGINYHDIFTAMGIPPKWVFAPGSSVAELRSVFSQLARSLAIAASSEAEFATQVLLGPPSSS